MRSGTRNARLLVEDINIEEESVHIKEKLSEDYKNLNEKCDAVLIKISKRKKTIKSK